MEGADKVTIAHARSMQPATPVATVTKSRTVEETGKSDKQTNTGDSVQQSGAPQQPSREELEKTVSEVSDFVQNIQRNLLFTVDDDSGETVIKVTDMETDDVIRQIPSEEVLQLQQYIKDASGILFKAKV